MADNKKSESPVVVEKELTVNEAIKEGIAMGIAMAAKQTQPQPQVQTRALKNERVGDCQVCRQGIYTVTGPACQNNHVKMIVLPPGGSHITKWFQGLFINGVCYRSNNAAHAIDVPALNDFAAIIDGWHRQEVSHKEGRERNVQAYLSNPLGL